MTTQPGPRVEVTGGRIARLMSDVARVLPEGGDWCDLEKAQTLASLVVGLRPSVVCEVGVWTGGSLVPLLLALRALQDAEVATRGLASPRRAVAVDAWSAEASCAGQQGRDAQWWASVDHDAALRTFRGRLERHGLASLCEVVRASSEVAPVPDRVDLLHLDGNHGHQAVRDVERFCPAVPVGGLLVMDDLQWSGGHVERARDLAVESGFRPLYALGKGVVLQRVRGPAR